MPTGWTRRRPPTQPAGLTVVRLRAEFLLCLLVFRHYGYQFWPQSEWGHVYGMAGAALLLVLLACVDVWWPLKAWAIGEELLTAGCTAAWLAWPAAFVWPFPDERCSQVVGFKLGSVGLVLVALLAWRIVTDKENDNETA